MVRFTVADLAFKIVLAACPRFDRPNDARRQVRQFYHGTATAEEEEALATRLWNAQNPPRPVTPVGTGEW
jgi:hypothetical protein